MQSIPQKITELTGISNETVLDAPVFDESLANQVDQITQDCIFVAHNVNFDYNFIRATFKRIGKRYQRKKLCTVRLSRKLLPGKRSYSLGKLCATEDIIIRDRHRATGDAEATVALFKKLITADTNSLIESSLNPQSLEALIPPHIQKGDFLALPEEQGIYYFLDAKQKIIYIGKAKNIKKRIHSHFSGNSNTGSKSYFLNNLYHIDFQLIHNELLLDIIEATEIKKHWPRYNRSMKRFSLNFGIFCYEDRKGYLRLNIGRCGKYDKPLTSFRTEVEAKKVLKEMVFEYDLCPRLAGLQPISSGKCNYVEEIECRGACQEKESASDYNKRVKESIKEKLINNQTFLIKDLNEETQQQSIVYVEKGRYKGYGVLPAETKVEQADDVMPHLETAYDDQDMSNLIHAYLQKNPDKVTYL
jgi:DNA polymerase-3 subunit epsilon